jgi:hypothetical protein
MCKIYCVLKILIQLHILHKTSVRKLDIEDEIYYNLTFWLKNFKFLFDYKEEDFQRERDGNLLSNEIVTRNNKLKQINIHHHHYYGWERWKLKIKTNMWKEGQWKKWESHKRNWSVINNFFPINSPPSANDLIHLLLNRYFYGD